MENPKPKKESEKLEDDFGFDDEFEEDWGDLDKNVDYNERDLNLVSERELK